MDRLTSSDRDITERLISAADQCVKCGLCLPHCPTYLELRDEADSPRGRIALIQGWAEGRLESSPRLQRHLGNCLECRACETVCPSLVRFGQMMDDARTLSVRRGPALSRLLRRLWLGALSARAGARAAGLLGAAYRATGLARFARWAGMRRGPALAAVHRILLQLEPPLRAAQPCGPRQTDPQGPALFVGCVARSAQPRLAGAARFVLARVGLSVEIPDGQACCGAMHRHNGLPAEADRLVTRNLSALGGRRSITLASACLAELRNREELSGAEDVCRLLADLDWPADARLRPLPFTVAVHEPCTQRNLLRDPSAASDLLRRIPGIELVALPGNAVCCGAAGTYLLQRPRLSLALLQPKLAALARLRAPIVVTTNTGCALHLQAGAREVGLDVEVMHPVELIARQLGLDGEAAAGADGGG